MLLKLTSFRDPVWKKKFKNLSSITPEIKKVVRDMQETLEITGGVGLAAPQVDLPFRLFIIDYANLKEVFINPKIVKYGKETDEIEEGCLSVPCVRGLVSRPTEIDIEYIDLQGNKKLMTFTGYYARIAQHEFDHLSSTFYLNRITNKKRIYSYPKVKIVFFGTPSFGATILKSLIGQQLVGEYEIPLVVTTPGKKLRNGQIKASPVRDLAEKFNLVVTEEKVSPNLVGKIKEIEPDFLVVASYGKILPKALLETAKRAPVNVHGSLLPKYRGASPIQNAILNGDKYTGVTLMWMNEKMDEGDILAKGKVKIGKNETFEGLEAKLADLGAFLTGQVIHLLTLNRAKRIPQKPSLATYTKLIKKEDGYFDWKKPPENLENMIRAYSPWPSAWTLYKSKVLKLLPGKMVQLEGKEPVKLAEFKRGHQDFSLEW